ncbi:hypothetical protein [Hoeflea sp.]|nr:hypothetical protein [Hoeflea sp.]
MTAAISVMAIISAALAFWRQSMPFFFAAALLNEVAAWLVFETYT